MINVIGIGQNRENMTLGAVRAIEESDVIVGYKKYVAQISDLVSDKEIIKKGMGDEIARAQLAIDKSLSGQTVSLISSGDPGVFGMANVLYQIGMMKILMLKFILEYLQLIMRQINLELL